MGAERPVPGPNDTTYTASGSGTPAGEPVDELHLVDSERYELRGEHARGGLGVVLRVFDRHLGREVALKRLQRNDRVARTRFLREATITSRLQHPSIVTVHDVVRLADGMPAYTMPLYPGQSLRAAIVDAPDLGARLALLPKALAVCEAIAHAHGREVLHRDIKPSNVLLGSLGETVVIDWGLAKSLRDADDEPATTATEGEDVDEPTRLGEIMGTPAYMAPEQARGEIVDTRADIYSLGALLYHVLAGQPAYRGGETKQLLHQLLQGPPPDMDADLRGVPAELLAIVKKAMARAAADRYPSAGALADDLRRFLNGVLVEAHEYTPAQLVRRWIARHRILVSSLGAALALVVLVTALAFRGVERERAVAQASAAHEKARASAMILTQAETVLARDPARAVAWLKTYPDDGEDWTRVRAIAGDAQREGVARHELRRALGSSVALLPRADGRHLLLVDGARTLYLWDVATGARRVVACLPEDLRAELRDETFGHDVAILLGDGRVLVWSEALGAPELVATVPGAQAVSLSSDGRWLAIAGDGGPARLVDRTTGAESLLAEGDLPVADVRFVPGTARLLVVGGAGASSEGLTRASMSAGAGATALLYDVAERRVVQAFLPGLSYPIVSTRGPHLLLVRPGSVDWLDARDLGMRTLPAKLNFFSPVDFTTDGRVVLGDRQSKLTQLWDPRRGTLAPLELRLGALGASPAGGAIASFGSEVVSAVQLDPPARRALLGHPKAIGRTVSFVDETVFASGADDGVARVWDLATPPGRTLRLGAAGYEPPFVVVGDGRDVLAGAQDGRVLRRRLGADDATELFRLDSEVGQLAATPDGAVVVVQDGTGGIVRHDARAGRTETLFAKVERLPALALSPDGRFAAGPTNHGGTVLVFDLAERRQRRLEGLRGDCFQLAFAPDSRSLALACSQGAARGVTLHDLAAGTTRVLEAPVAELRLVGYSPSGRYLFAAILNGSVIRWDVATGASTSRRLSATRLEGGVALGDELLVAFAGDGVRLAAFDLGVAWTLDPAARIGKGSVSPDGTRLVGAGNDRGATYVWDLRTHERWTAADLRTHRVPALGRDGHVVVASDNGTLHVFEPPRLDATTPSATRAWLDSLTSVELGDGIAEGVCE